MEEYELREEKILSPQEEKEIIRKAKKRVGFKIHGIIYLLAGLLFWVFWFFVFRGSDLDKSALNFCLFITLAWGICVIAHYLFVYKWNKTYIEKEIKYLKEQKEKELKQQQEE